ncbi:hypothetical protein M9Y10_001935 [Tritrichomonas musculus]|uniref:Serine/threonine-protein phosphatase n=1 Tax=Tritrichomonas musculus TaxID=1915356 RepID=A0ABR2L8C4_9EUKA
MNAKLDEMINVAMNTDKKNAGFTTPDQIHWLCTQAHNYFITEPSLMELDAPINICGDLHGKFTDLLGALKAGGMPPTSKWLFLGDYVDRGAHSLEVMCLLFALKLRYPNNIFLLRGNHETEEVSSKNGFLDECVRKVNQSVFTSFCTVFDDLPIAAIIGGKIFCIHGGLSPYLKELSQITLIDRPVKIPKSGFLTDLLWSDPSSQTSNFGDSPRGNTVIWGSKEASKFMQKNNIRMIIRGHQVAEAGYSYPFFPDKNVITLFTSSGMTSEKRINAAIMKIQANLSHSIFVLPEYKKRNRHNSLRDSRKRQLSVSIRPNNSVSNASRSILSPKKIPRPTRSRSCQRSKDNSLILNETKPPDNISHLQYYNMV